ncbi:hypothetical protein HPB50_004538 [Hyalomma asiaticum]|uniref:Uncharacterized protein n=1 Tax=Hyalomma asiaticum TaxID=266040 RepID=A0ACB7S2T1_HYAAI|nr:hypothetical protein HPB50_004538 [Hyalomma asiaticum]
MAGSDVYSFLYGYIHYPSLPRFLVLPRLTSPNKTRKAAINDKWRISTQDSGLHALKSTPSALRVTNCFSRKRSIRLEPPTKAAPPSSPTAEPRRLQAWPRQKKAMTATMSKDRKTPCARDTHKSRLRVKVHPVSCGERPRVRQRVCAKRTPPGAMPGGLH